MRNAFQEEINRRNVRELLSSRRDEMMADVKKEVLGAVRGSKPWGIDVTDVRITRIDYAESITSDVYRRMEAERERVAKGIEEYSFKCKNNLKSCGVGYRAPYIKSTGPAPRRSCRWRLGPEQVADRKSVV